MTLSEIIDKMSELSAKMMDAGYLGDEKLAKECWLEMTEYLIKLRKLDAALTELNYEVKL